MYTIDHFQTKYDLALMFTNLFGLEDDLEDYKRVVADEARRAIGLEEFQGRADEPE